MPKTGGRTWNPVKAQSSAGEPKASPTGEIMRCPKRHVAREVFGHLVHPGSVPVGTDLRQARREARLSLANVAVMLGSWSGRIPGLERGARYDTDLAFRYQHMLAAINSSAVGVKDAAGQA